MASGIGNQSFGSTPYGPGSPTDLGPIGGSLLRDLQTGLSTGSRRIDPVTKDYVVDGFGRIAGMNNVQQLVYLAVSTEYGSCAVQTLGQQLKKIDRITDNFAKRIESTLRAALGHLTRPNIIAILGVNVERNPVPGRAYGKLLWRDLTNGNEADTDLR